MELTKEQALQQGVTAHKEGKLQDAERLYRAILQSQPTHPDANHNLGVLAVSVNKADVALPLFKTALKANPKIDQFWLSYIDALIKEKQFENATRVLEQGKKQGLAAEKLDALESQIPSKTKPVNPPNPPQQQLNSLIRHYQNGQFDDAEKLAISITHKFPKHPFSWKILGILLGKKGRNFEAVDANTSAVTLSPQDAEVHNNLGVTLKELGRLDEAKASYEKAISLQPGFAESHNNLGVTLRELGRLDEAEVSYKQAISLQPDFAKAHYNLGITLKELGRLEEAKASYTQAIVFNSDYTDAHYNLGITLKKLGRLEQARLSYTQAIMLKADYKEAHNNLGNTLQELDILDEAEASFRQAIVLKYDFAEAHNNLGNLLKQLGRLSEAETSYTQAIKFKPNFAESHYNLGNTLQELNKFKEAEESYKQAIVLKPNYAEAHNNLGNTLKEQGRLDQAQASYSRAILVEPNNTTAHLNRWQLLFKKGDFEAALRDADFCDTKKSRVHSLETLFALGRIEEIYSRIEMLSDLDDENIAMAAFSSFIAEQEKRSTAHKFCKNPLSFIHFTNITSHRDDSHSFIREVVDELYQIKTIWEPNKKSTHKGFQTPVDVNLFAKPSIKMAQLQSIILDELDSYYFKFKNDSCSYIQKWPSKNNIWGWHVILKCQGHQAAHIHTGGWLSGVIYLKVVPSLEKGEGAIEFSLNGENYFNINSPKVTYQPKLGDIVFFPSSLHHKTIPFTTDTDRVIVSFDLIPKTIKL